MTHPASSSASGVVNNAADRGDYLVVAALLVEIDAASVSKHDKIWLNIEEARSRSAISRAYYAVFRALKSRLIDERVEWKSNARAFPQRSVRSCLKSALEEELGAKHDLVAAVKFLLRERNRSDYDFAPETVPADADDDIELGEKAIEQVRALTASQLASIAFHLDTIAKALPD
jgi:uncharacterized protein (UPF0332 family)